MNSLALSFLIHHLTCVCPGANRALRGDFIFFILNSLCFQEFFPGIIHTVFVLRPASFLQKALSEVSNKLFKEEFRFRVVVCSNVEELYEHFDRTQLTPDLGGELQYSHSEWIQQRLVKIFLFYLDSKILIWDVTITLQLLCS